MSVTDSWSEHCIIITDRLVPIIVQALKSGTTFKYEEVQEIKKEVSSVIIKFESIMIYEQVGREITVRLTNDDRRKLLKMINGLISKPLDIDHIKDIKEIRDVKDIKNTGGPEYDFFFFPGVKYSTIFKDLQSQLDPSLRLYDFINIENTESDRFHDALIKFKIITRFADLKYLNKAPLDSIDDLLTGRSISDDIPEEMKDNSRNHTVCWVHTTHIAEYFSKRYGIVTRFGNFELSKLRDSNQSWRSNIPDDRLVLVKGYGSIRGDGNKWIFGYDLTDVPA